jgi:transcriptional regulator with XRE-family HTH domain
MPSKLPHYLRQARRRKAFSQSDIARLLGIRSHAQISRYELKKRLPPLDTALAYEVILGRPLSELFAGRYAEIQEEIAARSEKLARGKGPHRNEALVARRKASLDAITNRC